jgi:hypothetical protein
MTRRQLLRQTSAAGAVLLARAADSPSSEIQVSTVSPQTVRITVGAPVPNDGALVENMDGTVAARLRAPVRAQTIKSGDLRIQVAPDPLAFTISTSKGGAVQQLARSVTSNRQAHA